MEDLTGQQLGPYRIIAPLGEGGMAAVYKAYQPSVDRYVALKILPRHLAGDPRFAKRFQQEARTIANLQHTNILPVHDYGQDLDHTYLVMPFVETGTLADLLKGGPLPLAQVQQVIAQVGDALDYAHAQGIVHRDIKPSNILIDGRGNCLLTDFGISKILSASATQLTATGDVIGTPAYMSPEQGLGVELDQRSDIYSLGVVLYEMVTGRQPYRAETPMAVIIKHIHDPLPLPRSLNPDLPEAVERMILKALAKDREQRFKTAGEMVAAIHTGLAPARVEPQRSTPLNDLETLVATEQAATGETAIARAPSKPAVPTPETLPPTPIRKPKTWTSMPRWTWGGLAVILVGILVVVWAISNKSPGTVTPTAMAVVDVPAAQVTTDQANAANATPSPTETITPSQTPTHSPTLTPTPTLGPGATQFSAVDGMVLVYVPAGEFQMGSEDGDGDEKPVHTVYLDAYWIDQTEVTMAQFQQFMESENYDANPCGNEEDHPVACVSWYDAQAYCQWAGRELPTEAEWEKAARGTDGGTYPWGDEFDCSKGNFDDETIIDDYVVPGGAGCDGYDRTAPVGSFPQGASPYGVLDMAGNVWEWVADWYASDYYGRSPERNPSGPDSGEYRVLRGGSWIHSSRLVRTADRNRNYPVKSNNVNGFRCARSP